eukprot:SAG31_NODE_4149_length_3529_cov_1.923032_3_plen_171_part_00
MIRGQIHGANQGWTGKDTAEFGLTSAGGPAGFGTMISVVYELVDVAPADGGFGAVPGSHRSQFSLPIPRRAHPVDGYPPLVTRIACRASTAIVFTEAMSHCTLPWSGNVERKTLFYKYTPRRDSPGRHTLDYSRCDDLRGLRPSLAQLLHGQDGTLADGVVGRRFRSARI